MTDVVTAGSPTAQVPGFPAGTHVLSLEQHGDVVPQLDGAPNPDSVEQTTVTFDAHPEAGGIAATTATTPTSRGRGAVDASTDPSVIAEQLASLHDTRVPRAAAGPATSQVFQITRAPLTGFRAGRSPG